MNYIKRLEGERDEVRAQLATALAELDELRSYLHSDKFSWPDGDYVHLRTDLLPKLQAFRSLLVGEGA